jgi:hypothetical protein
MKTSKIFRTAAVALMACASLLMTGCLDDDNNVAPADVPVSYVTLYNASPDAPDLNIIVDNKQINNGPFGYADNTGYLRFYTGERNLKFGPYGANNVTVDTVVTLVDSKAYSIFVVDNFRHAEVLVLTDTSASEPASGKALIRFVNLSPDAQPLALKVKDAASTLTGEQSFKGATAFMEVDVNDYNFDVVSSGGTELSLPNISLQQGNYYTVLVRGYKMPPSGNTNVLSGEVVQN